MMYYAGSTFRAFMELLTLIPDWIKFTVLHFFCPNERILCGINLLYTWMSRDVICVYQSLGAHIEQICICACD